MSRVISSVPHPAGMVRIVFNGLALAVGLGAAHVQAAVIDWTGFGVGDGWRSSFIPPFNAELTNWAVDGATALPGDGDTLRFKTAGNWATNTNDFAALKVAGIRFLNGAEAFLLHGNGLTSSSDIVNDSAAAQRIDLPITLGATQTWRNAGTGSLLFTALPLLGSHSLTLDGAMLDTPDGSLAIAGGNTVQANGGAQVKVLDTVIAGPAGSSGALGLDGGGTAWTTDLLQVGRGGIGTLRIDNGATLTNTLSPTSVVVGNAALGVEPGAEGTVTVDGGRWFNQEFYGQELPVLEPGDLGYVGMGDSGRIDVGLAGTGTLNVLGGGLVTVAALNVGRGAGSHGSVLVDGAGSVLKFVDGQTIYGAEGRNGSHVGFDIGVHGDGVLTVRNGGYAVHELGRIGVYAGASGTAIIDGGELAIGSRLELGRGGTGTLTVRNNGIAGGHEIIVGPHGKLTLGTGGTLHAAKLVLDGSAEGALELLDDTAVLDVSGLELTGDTAFKVPVGTQMSFASVSVGTAADSTAKLTVQGANTRLATTAGFELGSAAAVVDVLDGASLEVAYSPNNAGQINITNGGQVQSHGDISGNVKVDGVGSTLDVDGIVLLAHAEFSAGAQLRSGTAPFGDPSVATGLFMGSGTRWVNAGSLSLNGGLTFADGAIYQGQELRMLDRYWSSKNRFTANGAGTHVDLRDFLTVGVGELAVEVLDGATLDVGFRAINGPFASLAIRIDGVGSLFRAHDLLLEGSGSPNGSQLPWPEYGQYSGVRVSGGGILETGDASIGSALFSVGGPFVPSIDIVDPGSRWVSNGSVSIGEKTFTRVAVRSGGAIELNGTAAPAVFASHAELTLQSGHVRGHAIEFGGLASIDAASTVEVDKWTQRDSALHVDGLLQAAQIQVDKGGLSGTGTLRGDVHIGEADTVFVQPAGSLTIDGDLHMGHGARIFFHDIAGPGLQDYLEVSGNASFMGSEIVFRLTDSFVPQLGDSFQWLQVDGLLTGLDSVLWRVEVGDGSQGFRLFGDANGIVDPRMPGGLRLVFAQGRLSIAAVPLPGGSGLLALGLGAIAAYLRRTATSSGGPRTVTAR